MLVQDDYFEEVKKHLNVQFLPLMAVKEVPTETLMPPLHFVVSLFPPENTWTYA
jgi:hypothetical protein